jgi:dTMP kinase
LSAREDKQRGFLIAFEGIDGGGKSTQVRLLTEWLEAQGRRPLVLKEPTTGPIGMRIRELAKTGRLDARTEFELFKQDRRQNVEENILPGLRDGRVVLLDRYYISTMAYQGALGMDPEFIREANEAFAPRPDLVVLVDLPVDVALARIRGREAEGPNEFEKREMLLKVKGIFDSLTWPEVARLDGTLSVEDQHTAIRERVERLLGGAIE